MYFHFLTTTDDGTVIDDSRKYNKPMEISLGHKFKLDCWESCLKTMRVGEIAKFAVDKEASLTRLSNRAVIFSLPVGQRLPGCFQANSRLLQESDANTQAPR